MTVLPIVLAGLAAACAAVILWRALVILNRTHHRSHARGRAHFLGFGLSYVALGVSAVAAAMSLTGWPGHEGPLLGLLLASAGLILFDRRRPREDRHGMAIETLRHPADPSC